MLYVNLTTPEQNVKIKTPFFSEAIRDYLLHIGVPENLSRIKLSNKEDSPIRITLSGETEYDRHLAKIFSPLNSLFELNMTIQTLEDLDLRIKDNITNNILKDKYHSLRELRQGLRSEFLSLGDVSEVFYFPLSGIMYFDDDCRYYDIASAEELLNNEDIIREYLHTLPFASGIFMHECYEGLGREKLTYAEWDVEEWEGALYGSVSARFTEPLNADETESFKDWIFHENAERFGALVGDTDILTEDGILNLRLWNSDGYFILSYGEMLRYVYHRDDIAFAG